MNFPFLFSFFFLGGGEEETVDRSPESTHWKSVSVSLSVHTPIPFWLLWTQRRLDDFVVALVVKWLRRRKKGDIHNMVNKA